MLEIQVCLNLTIQILFLDLCFHLQGRYNFNLMVRLISFRQEKLCMAVQK